MVAALLVAAAAGVVIDVTVRRYEDTRGQVVFETITYLVAAAVLTYMTFWMRRHARDLSGELRARVDTAVTGRSRAALAFLAGQAVGREAAETTVFLLALTFSARSGPVLVGAVAGLVVAVGIAVFIYRLGHRLNLGRFFTIVGRIDGVRGCAAR